MGNKHLSKSSIIGMIAAAIVMAAILDVNFSNDDYVVKQGGRIEKAQPGQFGIPRKDAEFLVHFAGQLIDRIPENEADLKNEIRSQIMQGYRQDGQRLSEMHKFATDRERLIAYMMLRVNGSLPVYLVKTGLPNDLSGMLNGQEGNCLDAAFRLLMVLDAFGIKGRAIPWMSPSLTGHIVVDAYDDDENKAYLLDPTFNIVSTFNEAGRGYFDLLADTPVTERKQYLRENIKAFPFFAVETKGLAQGTDEFREEQYLKIKDATISALAYELPLALDYWKKSYPRTFPLTLEDVAGMGGNAGLRKYSPIHSLSTGTLLDKAGINPVRGLRSIDVSGLWS